MNFKNARQDEKLIITSIFDYFLKKYPNVYVYEQLRQIEVMDKLEGGSSARTKEHNIIVARENCLDMINIPLTKDINDYITTNRNICMVVSTLFHEMWHINTWDKYLTIYEYILYGNDRIKALAYKYWIEYIAHIDTVVMENLEYMSNFCDVFVSKNWFTMESGYENMLIQLPYFLVRSQFLCKYEMLCNQISNTVLTSFVSEINCMSIEINSNIYLQEIEKANIIYSRFIQLYND